MSDSLLFPLNRRRLVALSAAAFAQPLAGAASAGPVAQRHAEHPRIGRDQPLDSNWKFLRGTGEGFEAPDFDDAGWRTLDLPHDWSIEDLPPQGGSNRLGPFDPKSIGGTATAFSVGGEGWYRKRFQIEGLPPAGRVEVLFGGVYTESDVWLNGVHLGTHFHGYTPFGYDLTAHLRPGENVIAVRVRNQGKNSRWYSGSGIYRGVTLDVLPEPSHIERWGVGITTQRITDTAAEIAIETRLVEAATPGLTLLNRVRAPNGAVVAESSADGSGRVTQMLQLRSPLLWSPDSPTLYTLETELRRGASTIDKVITPFGVRIVSFDAERGMQLNGSPVKLRGGCVHHDNGLLGAAAYPDADERRVRLLKARGFNAIRSAHYPTSRAFADACDRQGMLLIEEAFDMWLSPKSPQDYSVHFADNYLADVSAMVLSARNHPSVIMWSIGNEVPDRSTPEGMQIAWNLANQVRRLDPTRPVTAAINGFAGRPVIPDQATARHGFAGAPDESAAVFLDVVGYNYKLDRYAADHERFPKRVMFGSESFPRDVFAAWSFIEAHPYVIGDFVWAAMDYLGEAGMSDSSRSTSQEPPLSLPGWPWIIDDQGDLDITGRQKPQSYARDVVWRVSPLEMAVHRPLEPGMYEHVGLWGWSDERQSWTWPGYEGQRLSVRVYSHADRVELFVNGKLVAAKTLSATEKLPVELQAPYAAGTLEAIAYRDGREIGRRKFETVGAPTSLRLTAEPSHRIAARGGLTYVWVEVTDASGRVVPDHMAKLQLAVSGPARLVGFGSANPLAVGSYQSSEAQAFDGRALAILRSDGSSGRIRIRGQSPGLRAGSLVVGLA